MNEGMNSGKPRNRTLAAVIVGIVIFIVVLLAAFELVHIVQNATAPPPKVEVTSIDVVFTSQWSDSINNGPYMFSTNAQYINYVSLYNSNLFTTCTAESVTMSTSGFTLVSSNTPLTVSPGQTEALSMIFEMPNYSYTGPVLMSVDVNCAL